jgi:hypothetical protein
MLEMFNDNIGRDGSLIVVALASLVVGYVYVATSRKKSKGLSIGDLPGPERVFLLGNFKNFPRKAWSTTFASWRHEMGEHIL